MAVIHGFNGRVRVGSASFHAYRWMANVRVTPIDVTNFVYFGSAAYASSLKEGELTFECIYDTVENPFAPGALLRPGASARCIFDLDRTGVETIMKWDFPKVIIMSVRQTHMIRDVSRFTVMAKVSVFKAAEVPSFPKA